MPRTRRHITPEDEDDNVEGQSTYALAKQRFENEDELFEHLRQNRLNDTTLCLGYYILRAKRHKNWTQTDVAARTKTAIDPPLTRSLISGLLHGQHTVSAGTWLRLARALEANPLEFYLAEGWVEPGDIAAYKVPHSDILLELSEIIQQIDPHYHLSFISMVKAVVEAVLIQQRQ